MRRQLAARDAVSKSGSVACGAVGQVSEMVPLAGGVGVSESSGLGQSSRGRSIQVLRCLSAMDAGRRRSVVATSAGAVPADTCRWSVTLIPLLTVVSSRSAYDWSVVILGSVDRSIAAIRHALAHCRVLRTGGPGRHWSTQRVLLLPPPNVE